MLISLALIWLSFKLFELGYESVGLTPLALLLITWIPDIFIVGGIIDVIEKLINKKKVKRR